MRKEADLHISDRIEIRFHAPEDLSQSLAKQEEHIRSETLAVSLTAEALPPTAGDAVADEEIDDWKVTIAIRKLSPDDR
jgi:hypothetical protein